MDIREFLKRHQGGDWQRFLEERHPPGLKVKLSVDTSEALEKLAELREKAEEAIERIEVMGVEAGKESVTMDNIAAAISISCPFTSKEIRDVYDVLGSWDDTIEACQGAMNRGYPLNPVKPTSEYTVMIEIEGGHFLYPEFVYRAVVPIERVAAYQMEYPPLICKKVARIKVVRTMNLATHTTRVEVYLVTPFSRKGDNLRIFEALLVWPVCDGAEEQMIDKAIGHCFTERRKQIWHCHICP